MQGPIAASIRAGSAPAACCSARMARPAICSRVPRQPAWTAAAAAPARTRMGTQSATRTPTAPTASGSTASAHGSCAAVGEKISCIRASTTRSPCTWCAVAIRPVRPAAARSSSWFSRTAASSSPTEALRFREENGPDDTPPDRSEKPCAIPAAESSLEVRKSFTLRSLCYRSCKYSWISRAACSSEVAVDRSARELRGALHEDDALSASVPDHLPLRVHIRHSLQHDPSTAPLDLVHGARPGTTRIPQQEAVALDVPAAGAVGDPWLLAIDGDGQGEAAEPVLPPHQRSPLGQDVLRAVRVRQLRAGLADLDQLVHAIELRAGPDRLHCVLSRREPGFVWTRRAEVRAPDARRQHPRHPDPARPHVPPPRPRPAGRSASGRPSWRPDRQRDVGTAVPTRGSAPGQESARPALSCLRTNQATATRPAAAST